METLKVVGTLIESEGKMLLLKRTDGRWGLPGGGVEQGEDLETAAVREIQEETGYPAKKQELEFVLVYDKPLKSTKTNSDITYTLFRLKLKESFKVRLDKKEHTDYSWLTPEDAIILPDQIPGLADVIKKAYGIL